MNSITTITPSVMFTTTTKDGGTSTVRISLGTAKRLLPSIAFTVGEHGEMTGLPFLRLCLAIDADNEHDHILQRKLIDMGIDAAEAEVLVTWMVWASGGYGL